ncbi:hypothetical protein C8R47DRAFT_1202633 [Mycena vitilis]|nr:hypothetical protein C8R47DRAFT_1202633 [Mycena vitilis]
MVSFPTFVVAEPGGIRFHPVLALEATGRYKLGPWELATEPKAKYRTSLQVGARVSVHSVGTTFVRRQARKSITWTLASAENIWVPGQPEGRVKFGLRVKVDKTARKPSKSGRESTQLSASGARRLGTGHPCHGAVGCLRNLCTDYKQHSLVPRRYRAARSLRSRGRKKSKSPKRGCSDVDLADLDAKSEWGCCPITDLWYVFSSNSAKSTFEHPRLDFRPASAASHRHNIWERDYKQQCWERQTQIVDNSDG